MGAWAADSKTHVSTMSEGDFCHNEKSVTVDAATTVRIEHTAKDGSKTVLKDGIDLLAGEVIDGTRMSKKALVDGDVVKLTARFNMLKYGSKIDAINFRLQLGLHHQAVLVVLGLQPRSVFHVVGFVQRFFENGEILRFQVGREGLAEASA